MDAITYTRGLLSELVRHVYSNNPYAYPIKLNNEKKQSQL